MRSTALAIIFLLVSGRSFCLAPEVVHNPILDYYGKVTRLWARHIPNTTPQERWTFCTETYRGSQRTRELRMDRNGNLRIVDSLAPDPDLLAWLTAISVAETDGHKRWQYKFGFLGGHADTIRRGLTVTGGAGISDPQLNDKIYALSRWFSLIYRDTYPQKAIRIWNQGPKWKERKAWQYWKGVELLKAKYEKNG